MGVEEYEGVVEGVLEIVGVGDTEGEEPKEREGVGVGVALWEGHTTDLTLLHWKSDVYSTPEGT